MSDSPKRVFIVDDNEEVLELAERYLSRRGFEVTTTTVATRVAKLVRETNPHAIVLDVMMPGMDGHYVSHILRSDPVNDAIPIIFYTALDIADIEGWMRDIPISRWVAKSNGVKGLHTAIVELTAQRVDTIPAPEGSD